MQNYRDLVKVEEVEVVWLTTRNAELLSEMNIAKEEATEETARRHEFESQRETLVKQIEDLQKEAQVDSTADGRFQVRKELRQKTAALTDTEEMLAAQKAAFERLELRHERKRAECDVLKAAKPNQQCGQSLSAPFADIDERIWLQGEVERLEGEIDILKRGSNVDQDRSAANGATGESAIELL